MAARVCGSTNPWTIDATSAEPCLIRTFLIGGDHPKRGVACRGDDCTSEPLVNGRLASLHVIQYAKRRCKALTPARNGGECGSARFDIGGSSALTVSERVVSGVRPRARSVIECHQGAVQSHVLTQERDEIGVVRSAGAELQDDRQRGPVGGRCGQNWVANACFASVPYAGPPPINACLQSYM